MQRVHEALRDNNGVVLAISIDASGEKAVKSYLAWHGFSVPTLLDTGLEVARRFGVRAVPTTYIVNRAAAVVAQGFGPLDFDSLELTRYIQALLAQPPSSL